MRRHILNKHYWSLIWYQSISNLKAESARGYLGILWWVIEPVLYMAAFYVVFSIMKQHQGDAVEFLLCGLVVWRWFAGSLGQGANSLANGANLMRQVYIPKFVFPCVSIVSNVPKFFVVFVMLLLFLVFSGTDVSEAWYALPVLLLVELLVIAATVCFVAAIVPFFPDIQVIISNVILLLFFLSGVIFDISQAPEHIKVYLYLNPMVTLVEDFRLVLMQGFFPDWQPLLMISAASLLLLLLAAYILVRFDRIYPKRLLR